MCIFSKSAWTKNLKLYKYSTHFRLVSNFNYKNTIFLPKTDFPHRVKANHVKELQKNIEKKARFEELYKWQTQNKIGDKLFVLHDGPPYANGDVHIGHAVNKILKDITLRHKILSGHQVHFVPGWDCHGLPIELKVAKSSDGTSSLVNKIELRKKAFEFSKNAKAKQMDVFKTWGLLADWNNIYVTCNPDYIANQWKLFHSLYEKKLIYPDYKPVFWSPTNRTSLAEAELEYNPDHVSTSIYVKFPVTKFPAELKSHINMSSNVFAVIWTTTPWSLPANQAICYAENKNYSIVQSKENKEFYLIATEMIESLKGILGSNVNISTEFPGSLLKEFTYAHPLHEKKEFPFVCANHVTMSKGTGLVHMAPNHGLEDYAAAHQHNIPLSPCIVDEDGSYNFDAGENLVGKYVLGSGGEKVLELLSAYIIHKENYKHSYPYDWRSNKPVIIRSSNQWFIDCHTLKKNLISALNDVEVIPSMLKKPFVNQLENSPPWCISRQRAWGVPIPVFYQGDKRIPVVNRQIIEHLCKLVEDKGIHIWWELPESQLLPRDLLKKCDLPNVEYSKGEDILDIWFDSGISWSNVLPEPKVSDICIEGIDQIRGWFNSSLVTSVAFRNVSPYRKIFLHGFTLDANGCKMSKSKGNVISPVDITDGNSAKKSPALGVDVLRWWVAFHACQHENIALKPNVLEECSQNISKFRNVLKFLLGSLHGFNFDRDKITIAEMRPLDQYILNLSNLYLKRVYSFYDLMQFKYSGKEIVNFITNEVSSFYCHLIKDRLYCDSKDAISRRSCQMAISLLLDVIVKSLAPVLPHLVEEVYSFHNDTNKERSGVFRRNWNDLQEYIADISYPQSILCALDVRNVILKSERKVSSVEAIVSGSEQVLKQLKELQGGDEETEGNLCELLQTAKVTLLPSLEGIQYSDSCVLQGSSKEHNFTVILVSTLMGVCPRCRRCKLSNDETLCNRCQIVIHES